MCTEIETKLKVESLGEVEKKLEELGAEFLGEQLQEDCYFDDAGRTLTKGDRCLRLRRQVAGGNEKIFLTYKGAKEKARVKKRREIEFEIEDGDAAGKLFAALGYEQRLVFEKKRRLWRLGGCEVALDEVGVLGSFVEIEGSDEKQIADVQELLGLASVAHIKESYACLISERMGR